MNKDPAKDFGAIADDYVFFETHSTEAQEDLRAYGAQLASWRPAGDVVRMLDFGGGSGTFTERFLDKATWPTERLQLTLVDPAEEVRVLAVERLAKFTGTPVVAMARLPEGNLAAFDLILANHVFYYVPDVETHVKQLIAALAPNGIWLTAIAGRTNRLFEFWLAGFGEIGREIPYNTAEDVEAALAKLNVPFDKQLIPYRLEFADTRDNRLKMIRFLLAEHLTEMRVAPLLALFDKYSRAERIVIETTCEHFVVRK